MWFSRSPSTSAGIAFRDLKIIDRARQRRAAKRINYPTISATSFTIASFVRANGIAARLAPMRPA